MSAEVVGEMSLVDFVQETYCDSCDNQIGVEDACYTCSSCKNSICMHCCSHLQDHAKYIVGFHLPPQVAQPPFKSNISAGDVFYCGPDRWGIHHVILACGPLVPDLEVMHFMNGRPGEEAYSCMTIESSQEMEGENMSLYFTRSMFFRNVATGEAVWTGSIELEDDGPVITQSVPVPVKTLLHPLRPGYGGPPFDPFAFERAVRKCARLCSNWGLRTALKAFASNEECLDPTDYPDFSSRLKLLVELRERWTSRPICSSVVIIAWQIYFEIVCSSAGPHMEEFAINHILRWVPVFSDSTAPSVLLKTLTKCGWVLRGNIDA